eukprot:TRINITY_DN3016_c0_g1_i1.p1 TRINITY_DN3016_c0_g1~~TRINITY_DN3016_c0_g1_i1.p1  ORF type:complete len:417 (-),score=46.29 TRINITY_DN3016_c0_g1_i1:949-2199(-)
MEPSSSFLQRIKLRSMEFLAELNDYPNGYPPGDSPSAEKEMEAAAILVSNVLAVVSAFRAAYMQLQLAHTPFDEEAVKAADRAAITQLKRLTELRRHRRRKDGEATLAVSDGRLQAQVHERQYVLRTYELILNRLESEIRSKDAEVEAVKAEIEHINRENKGLERRLGSAETSAEVLSVELFVRSVRQVSVAAQEFTRLLMGLMKEADWDLECAANSIEPHVRFLKESHWKFAFESYVSLGMFGGFESEDFCLNGGLPSILDHQRHRLYCFMEYEDMVKREDPYVFLDSPFGKFCHKKYLQIVHPRMEDSFFGNVDQRELITNGGHPRTPFYNSFLKLAKAVWLVHRLAYSFYPAASIFQVRRGTDFSSLLMESVVPGRKILKSRPKVAFTVMPGFRVEKAVVQCQVYLETQTTNG